jgi:predicted NAD/FAD-dependent oxidoreductase
MADVDSNPSVTIVGAGVAGLTAAHRLLERGYDVTLLEANAFIGGKLAAHQDTDSSLGPDTEDRGHEGAAKRPSVCPACQDKGGCLRTSDWHEHCYHMYLNWYHNFWDLMFEINALNSFVQMPEAFNINPVRPGTPRNSAIPVVNVGSPWTTLRNLFCGLDSPADMYLWNQTMADLTGAPARRDSWLEKTSITAFMRSQPYVTDKALAGTFRTTAQAFASPSYLSSARSFKALLTYGLRLPEPMMWLLAENAQDGIFTPWLTRLSALADHFEAHGDKFFHPGEAFTAAARAARSAYKNGGKLKIRMLTPLRGLKADMETGRITHIVTARCWTSPTVYRGSFPIVPKTEQEEEIEGDLVLAVPPSQLSQLITPQIAQCAPNLPGVRYLRCEPMISIDLFFRKKLPKLPKGITLLLNSPYEMSFLDSSQAWKSLAGGNTVLNVVASNADTLVPLSYADDDILEILLNELRRYIEFDRSDVFDCRTHLQTNVGEELFVNQVGSWQWRPQATSGISNLYLAGDYCQTFVDVVTVEGAVVSGLMAAEALRRHRRRGNPIRILEPDQYPVMALSALATAQRPMAWVARGISSADEFIKNTYSQCFPNG